MLYTVAKLMIINASPKLFNLSYRKQIIVRFTKLFTKRFPKFVWNSGSSISLRSCQSNRELGNEIMNFTPNFVGKLRSLLQKKFAPFGVSLQSLATTRVHTCQKLVLPANPNLKFWQSNFKGYLPTWERFDTSNAYGHFVFFENQNEWWEINREISVGYGGPARSLAEEDIHFLFESTLKATKDRSQHDFSAQPR